MQYNNSINKPDTVMDQKTRKRLNYLALAVALIAFALYFFVTFQHFGKTSPEKSDGRKDQAGQKKDGTGTASSSDSPADNTGNLKTDAGSRPDPESLLESLKKAMAEGDWQKSKVICEQLAKAGPRAFELLAEILKNNESTDKKDVELRWRAAYILGLMEDTKVIPVFDEALGAEQAEAVRNMIMLGLGRIQDDATAPILERLLLDEKEGETARRSSAAYLAQLETGISKLIDIIQDGESTKDTRLWAIEALPGAKDARQCAAVLHEILNSEQDSRFRSTAAKVMGEIADPDSVNSITATLKEDSDFRVRVACAAALGNFRKSESAYNSLIDSLQNDKDARVRRYAAKSLGSIEKKDVVMNFEESLRTERDRVVRTRIAEALGKIGGEKSRALLEDLSKHDPSIHVRRAADEALKSLHN
jgi:HEAT repeat protein